MKNLLFLVLVVSACKSSNASSTQALPCDPGATELGKRLDLANGLGIDLSDPKSEAKIAEAKKGLEGTKVAFKNCAFGSQGGGSVTFAASRDAQSGVECAMAGGKDGQRKFRQAAMEFDMLKMKLDVSGKVGTHEGKLGVVECSITPHE